MKASVVLIACALVAAVATTASAQIDLSWRNCPSAGPGEPLAVSNENFNCSTPTTYTLHGTFKLPVDFPPAGALVYLEIEDASTSSILPFWRFDPPFLGTGCNYSAFKVSGDRDSSGGCSEYPDAWQGADTFSLIGDYSIAAPNKARVELLVAGSNNPAVLAGNTTYYLFHIKLSTVRSTMCAGCNDNIVIRFVEAILRDNLDPIHYLYLYGQNTGTDSATVNASSTPARNMLWGRLKALYR